MDVMGPCPMQIKCLDLTMIRGKLIFSFLSQLCGKTAKKEAVLIIDKGEKNYFVTLDQIRKMNRGIRSS